MPQRKYRDPPRTIIFRGKRYSRQYGDSSKSGAKWKAQQYRNQGYNATVKHIGENWWVYIRKK